MAPRLVREVFQYPQDNAAGGLAIQTAGLGIAYFLVAAAAIVLASTSRGFAGIWFANAIALGFLLRHDPGRVWAFLGAIFIGGLLANLVTGTQIAMAAPLMAANVAEIAFAAIVIRFLQLPTDQFGDDHFAYVGVLLVAAVAAPMISASLASLTWLAKGVQIGQAWWSWWSADAAGAIAILPIALSISRASIARTFLGRTWWRFWALAILCVGVTYLASTFLDHHTIVISLPLLVAALISTPLATAVLAFVAMMTIVVATYASDEYLSLLLTASLLGGMPYCVSLLVSRLRHSATHDSLTGLASRSAFEESISDAGDSVGGGRQHAICFIDLDRFKIVNDTAGHAAGDALLRVIANVIRRNSRRQDIAARIGGDEFGLLMFDCSADQAESATAQIIAAIGEVPFVWEGRAYEAGASAGITMLTASSSDLSTILSEADVACYTAKSLGRNRVAVYQPGTSEAHRQLRGFQVAVGLRSAIEKDRFCLYAQEIRDLRPTGQRQRHFELLLRLKDDNGVILEPSSFIPAAERFDMMGAIDRWVVHHALGIAGPGIAADPSLSISINLSATSLNDPRMWPFLEAELRASRIPANCVRLEVTETGLINSMTATTSLLAAARAAGCAIVLDDFGTGLSSFTYLRSFPIDFIKIDGSFVSRLGENPVDRTIVEAINDVAHRLGARTIAEGVEDLSTMALLRAIGVDEAQGYAIGRPQLLDDMLSDVGMTRRLSAVRG